MAQEFRIDLLRCEDTGVLVATSKDIPGLVLEAPTCGGIVDALMERAPRLIESNLGLQLKECHFTLPEQTISMRSSFTMEPRIVETA